ncbi:hypothetical protein C8T65DRAFT_30576 [Cerioporus squamosus]|nr:hypothetical protein C8T65DRAFT_30576 [Cerioporus squamosus]
MHCPATLSIVCRRSLPPSIPIRRHLRLAYTRLLLCGYPILDMPIPSLPTELTDEIIAWIPLVCKEVDRYPTLLVCSLVCWAWVPASRHQLFHELIIENPKQYNLLVSRVLHSETMRGYLRFVRVVDLAAYKEPAAHTRRAFTLEFAGHLSNATTMSIAYEGVEAFMSHPHAVHILAISRFSSIYTLKLLYCDFPSFGALRRFLTSLPSLTSLELHRPSWPDPAADLSPSLLHGSSRIPRPALSDLKMNWAYSNRAGPRRVQQFLAWLSDTATSTSLRRLELDSEGARYMDIGSSLSRLGRLVKALRIVVYEDDTGYESLLSGFRNMQGLHIETDRALQPDTWVRIARIMHALPCPVQLVLLCIRVRLDLLPFRPSGAQSRDSNQALYEALWQEQSDGLRSLDTALPQEQFEKLKVVHLQVRGFSKPMLDVIKNKMPGLFARNIVEVSDWV